MPNFLQNEVVMKVILNHEDQVPSNYKIAFIADTHNYYDDLSDAVVAINRNGPYAFVIVAGDITNEGFREEYLKTEEILGKLKVPHLVLVGNHDLLANGDEIYSKLYGSKNFSFTFRDLTFVFANNNNWESEGPVPDLNLIGDLFASAAINRILVTHVAPNDSDRFKQGEIERFETFISSQGISFIFHGHNHNPTVSTFGGATMITIGAPTKRIYSELVISAGGPSHRKVSF